MIRRLAGQTLVFWQLIREISIDEIRADAEQSFLIGVVGSEPTRTAIVDAILEGAGADARRWIYPAPVPQSNEDARALQRASIIVAYAGEGDVEAVIELARLPRPSKGARPVLLVVPEGVQVPRPLPLDDAGSPWRLIRVSPALGPELAERLAVTLPRMAPEFALALGRRLPVFRAAATQSLIAEASKGNARFAALSNIPQLIPVIGNFIAAAGDLLILTKNQMLLVYKLAALHGRDLDNANRLIAEVAPVIGAAFLWRTAARQLASFVPAFIGAVPKVFVAYTGTYVVGQMAAFYYATGERPSKNQIDEWYRQALNRLRRGIPGVDRLLPKAS